MMKNLIYILLMFSSVAVVAQAKRAVNPLPFLTPGEYVREKGPEPYCEGGPVAYRQADKVLTIGAQFNFMALNRSRTRLEEGNPRCRLSDDYKVIQRADHTELNQPTAETVARRSPMSV